MEKLKVMTVVGTRPEIIRLSAVIQQLEKSEAIEHYLVHSGQNYDYELNEIFFKDFELDAPDYFLDAATGNPMETIGNVLKSIDPLLDKIKPDAFLVLGDTNSCLAAIAAKRRKIPVFHMEAGNRCFDQRVPEEMNRKIVDHVADINMPYSSIAREYLLNEGFPADRIIKTGSPMYEVLKNQKEKIDNSDVLKRLKLSENQYFVVSAHREENINSEGNFKHLMKSLNAIAENYCLPIIFSAHPRTQRMIKKSEVQLNSYIKLIKPLGFNDYVKLQKDAKIVLSDSGTISEEASIMNLNALNIRQAHERPEGMEETVAPMVGLKFNRILQGISVLLSRESKNREKKVFDYFVDDISLKVVSIIVSYVNYVSENVWKN